MIDWDHRQLHAASQSFLMHDYASFKVSLENRSCRVSSSHFGRSDYILRDSRIASGYAHILWLARLFNPRLSFEYSRPPSGGIQRTVAIVHGWVHVIEEVINMPNNDTAYLVLWDNAMHQEGETDQHPRQKRCLEDHEPKEAKACLWIPTAPNVDENAGEGVAKKRH